MDPTGDSEIQVHNNPLAAQGQPASSTATPARSLSEDGPTEHDAPAYEPPPPATVPPAAVAAAVIPPSLPAVIDYDTINKKLRNFKVQPRFSGQAELRDPVKWFNWTRALSHSATTVGLRDPVEKRFVWEHALEGKVRDHYVDYVADHSGQHSLTYDDVLNELTRRFLSADSIELFLENCLSNLRLESSESVKDFATRILNTCRALKRTLKTLKLVEG